MEQDLGVSNIGDTAACRTYLQVAADRNLWERYTVILPFTPKRGIARFPFTLLRAPKEGLKSAVNADSDIL
jgi:hypothetical protein